jgi:hypothetical protein
LVNGVPSSTITPRNGLANTGADSAARTGAIAKSVCSAILGSAAMLIK